MSNYMIQLSLLVLMTSIACGPPTPSAESGESTPLIETQCSSLCERAIACESEEFAANWWGFTTQSECVESCLEFTQITIEVRMNPECEIIMGDLWACAGMIEECRVFRSFEDHAFGGVPFYDHPCDELLFEQFDSCLL